MADWFRKVSWTSSDQDDFWKHHRRARVRGKSQYLRIQAGHLAATKKPDLMRAALGLLDLLVAEFPDRVQLSFALTQRAELHATEGRIEEAIADLRRALAQEREFPNARGDAWLDFGWLAVTTGRPDLFDEALVILKEREADVFFPVHHFRLNAIRCLIAADRGDLKIAQNFAATALRHASRTDSGIRYHATIGLVSEMRGSIFDRLEKIRIG